MNVKSRSGVLQSQTRSSSYLQLLANDTALRQKSKTKKKEKLTICLLGINE